MEYLQQFDENKKMINEKIDRELKKTLTGNKYFMVILLFIENDKGKFLLQKTSKMKDSLVATTGGHVEFGDDGLKTTIKEANEELGINLLPSEISYVDTITCCNCYIEVYYTNKPINIDELKLQQEEVESVKWYTVDEINKLTYENKLRKGNIEPFKRLLEYKKDLIKGVNL